MSTLKGRRFKCNVNKFQWLKKIKNNAVVLSITSQKDSFSTMKCLAVHWLIKKSNLKQFQVLLLLVCVLISKHFLGECLLYASNTDCERLVKYSRRHFCSVVIFGCFDVAHTLLNFSSKFTPEFLHNVTRKCNDYDKVWSFFPLPLKAPWAYIRRPKLKRFRVIVLMLPKVKLSRVLNVPFINELKWNKNKNIFNVEE